MTSADELDQQLDAFIDQLMEEKDQIPSSELDDKFWKDLERHPFFLKEMPKDGEELHPATEALQALKWDDDDDTPLDRATKYKDEGNKYFQYKKYRNAIIAYSEGIKQRCSDVTINAVLFCNRATANYYLGNYRSAIRDCALARKCKPDHLKALIKGAESSMKLEKYKDVQNWCSAALTFSPNDPKLVELRDRAARLQKEKERDERKQQNKERKEKDEQEKILRAIERKKIRIQNDPSFNIFDRNRNPTGGTIQWNETEEILIFPVVFLYPEHGQTDHIQSFAENTRLGDQLEEMFKTPPPWDEEGKYTLDRIALYYEDRDAHQMKILSPDLTLLEALRLPGFVVQMGLPSFIIMVPDSPFAEHYLKMFSTL